MKIPAIIVVLLLMAFPIAYGVPWQLANNTTYEAPATHTATIMHGPATIGNFTLDNQDKLTGAVSAEQYVQVDWIGQAIDQISPYITHDVGKIYLVVGITIANHGYDDVSTYPNYFSVEVNNVKYSYDSSSFSLKDIGKPVLANAHLGDGGQISGYLVFQIPADTTRFNLIYDPGDPSMKVRYIDMLL